MVMDAQPSPQSVGREFVRQYYTLLNRAPNHLFRFYNNHSIFFHDGDTHNRDATHVIGQKNIHNKIQQLNFRDVHAKISQVDAQATLGNGVVVQVTGELSNDGQPMRRFTQTFVLAPQSPKNYYVHNDIFRYQDLYSDDENDGESRSENDEEQETETKIADNGQQNAIVQPQIFHPFQTVPAHPPVEQTVQMPAFSTQPPQVNGVHDELLPNIQAPIQASQIVPQIADPAPQQPPAVQALPTAASLPSIALSTTATVIVSSSPLEPMTSKENILIQTHNASPDANLNEPVSKAENEVNKKDDYKTTLEHTEKPDAIKMSQNEPKTYANLFKSMSSSGNSGFVPLPQISHQGMNSQSMTKTQDQRSENNQTSLPQRTSSTRQIKDFPERRTSNSNTQFVDSQQLFLGNVPHHATEEELKALFSKYGNVIDLRIHSKTMSKVPGVRLPPNYGFITYEDPESVQNCLSHCPLYFPDNSPDGQKLNVEEKKTRLRGSNDLPRLSNNMSSGGMGNSQRPSGGQNRSLSNSGGMMRGGSGGGGGGGPLRGSTGGPRPTGGFARNDRGPGGPPNRGNGNGTPSAGGNNNYNRR